jgi:hypothetical protein
MKIDKTIMPHFPIEPGKSPLSSSLLSGPSPSNSPKMLQSLSNANVAFDASN